MSFCFTSAFPDSPLALAKAYCEGRLQFVRSEFRVNLQNECYRRGRKQMNYQIEVESFPHINFNAESVVLSPAQPRENEALSSSSPCLRCACS